MNDDPDDSWQSRALCAGKRAADWDSRHIIDERQAEALCSSCPVRGDCALWAIEQIGLCGVVVAGVALPDDPGSVAAYEGARKALAARNGIRYRRWCLVCEREFGPALKHRARGKCAHCYESAQYETRKVLT